MAEQDILDAQKVTDEDLQNVVISSVEGGSGYWSQSEHYKWQNVAPIETVTRIRFAEETVDGSGVYNWDEPLSLDPEVMRKNITTRAAKLGVSIRAYMDNLDASEADVIVQLSTLGEIRYG